MEALSQGPWSQSTAEAVLPGGRGSLTQWGAPQGLGAGVWGWGGGGMGGGGVGEGEGVGWDGMGDGVGGGHSSAGTAEQPSLQTQASVDGQ